MKQVGKNTVEFYKPKTYGTTVACKKKKTNIHLTCLPKVLSN